MTVGIIGADTSSTEANRKIAELWYQAFDQGDPVLLETILSEDWVDIPSPPGQMAGAEGAQRTMKRLRTAFPDFRIAIKDVLQDGRKIVVRSEMTGTQLGSFLGAPGSGRTITVQAIDIHEIRDAKIVQTWHTEDWMKGLRQLGFFGLDG